MTVWEMTGRWPGVRRGMVRGPVAGESPFLSGTNEVQNPSFETDLADWVFTQPGSLRVAGGVDGSWCAQVPDTAATNDYGSAFTNTSVVAAPTEAWSAQLWVQNGTPELYIRWLDAAELVLSAAGPMAASGEFRDGFQRYTITSQVAPASTAFVRVEGYNQHATEAMLVDAVSLVQVG